MSDWCCSKDWQKFYKTIIKVSDTKKKKKGCCQLTSDFSFRDSNFRDESYFQALDRFINIDLFFFSCQQIWFFYFNLFVLSLSCCFTNLSSHKHPPSHGQHLVENPFGQLSPSVLEMMPVNLRNQELCSHTHTHSSVVSWGEAEIFYASSRHDRSMEN